MACAVSVGGNMLVWTRGLGEGAGQCFLDASDLAYINWAGFGLGTAALARSA